MASRRAARTESEAAQRLVDAAWSMVREGGLHAASSRAITDAAGVNLASITYHFGSKDELLARSLISKIRSWIEPALTALADTSADPSQRLLRAVLMLNEALLTAQPDSAVLLDALAAARHLPALQHQLQTLLAELRVQLARHLADPVFELPSWVDPDLYAALLIAIGTGIAVQVSIDPDSPTPAQLTSQLALTLLAARSSATPAPHDATTGHRETSQPPRTRTQRGTP